MNEKEFMDQRARNMTIEELEQAISLKKAVMTFSKEINLCPERFERLTIRGFEKVKHSDGVSSSNDAVIINSVWNCSTLTEKVYYVSFKDYHYKEIIRRK